MQQNEAVRSNASPIAVRKDAEILMIARDDSSHSISTEPYND